jgi:Rieske Fe-S protein
VEPHEPGHERPHLPAPTLWPIGFAVGIAVLLIGLVVNPEVIASVGGALMLVFGFLWVREATTEYRGAPAPVEPERRPPTAEAPALPANVGEAAMAPPSPGERFPRSRFLEGATLGLGAVIGGVVTVPVLGFAVLPSFTDVESKDVDLGPLDKYANGQWYVATFLEDPKQGEVSRRTAYVRNNGELDGQPSFTIITNRCAHLGCPVQPNGPVFDKDKTELDTGGGQHVTLIRTLPAGGFGCPCHGGQYDPEGNRIAGPPVRALDRFDYSIRDGRLWLTGTYSVSHVDGEGAKARIHKYGFAGPGEHVDGPEAWLYPLQPPH